MPLKGKADKEIEMTRSVAYKDKVEEISTATWFPEKSQPASLWDKFCAYALIFWDGTGFFGLSMAKLGRLRGEKVNFLTKFQAVDWVLVQCSGFIILFAVIISELNRYNTLKNQTINMKIIRNQTYSIAEAIPLFGGHWFFLAEFVPKINSFRQQWQGSSQYRPHTRDLSTDFKKWSTEDKAYIEEFFCNRTKVTYKEQYYWDVAVLNAEYSEFVDFPLRCSLSPVVNEKIRVIF